MSNRVKNKDELLYEKLLAEYNDLLVEKARVRSKLNQKLNELDSQLNNLWIEWCSKLLWTENGQWGCGIGVNHWTVWRGCSGLMRADQTTMSHLWMTRIAHFITTMAAPLFCVSRQTTS